MRKEKLEGILRFEPGLLLRSPACGADALPTELRRQTQ